MVLCKYGASCRFGDKCKFEHAVPSRPLIQASGGFSVPSASGPVPGMFSQQALLGPRPGMFAPPAPGMFAPPQQQQPSGWKASPHPHLPDVSSHPPVGLFAKSNLNSSPFASSTGPSQSGFGRGPSVFGGSGTLFTAAPTPQASTASAFGGGGGWLGSAASPPQQPAFQQLQPSPFAPSSFASQPPQQAQPFFAQQAPSRQPQPLFPPQAPSQQQQPISFMGDHQRPSPFSFIGGVSTNQPLFAPTQPAAPAFTGFKVPSVAPSAPPVTMADMSLTHSIDELSESDKEAFRADEFAEGRIPEVPPTQSFT